MSGILITNVQYAGEETSLYLEGAAFQRWTGAPPAEATVIAGKGLTAVSGLIDRHVHFRDPGLTEKEDLLSGARAAAAGGYCSVVCEPNTRPVIDTVDAVAAFDRRVADLGLPIFVRTKAALTRGQLGEKLVDIPALSEHVSAFSDDGEPVTDEALLGRALDAIGRLEHYTEITAHCEETPRSGGKVRAALGLGPKYAREPEIIALHLRAWDAHLAPLHVQHVSMASSAEAIAKAKNLYTRYPHLVGSGVVLPLTAEVTPHHLLLCVDDVPRWGGAPDANWKMNPPLRSRADMLAMRRALADGVIDYIATDHAPHRPEEKSRGWDEAPFGVIGLETALGACLSLYHAGEITFDRLIAAMTLNGWFLTQGVTRPTPSCGITLIDLQKRWRVEPDTFYSKARNCPFVGTTFTGKAMYTIVNGQVAMAEGTVNF